MTDPKMPDEIYVYSAIPSSPLEVSETDPKTWDWINDGKGIDGAVKYLRADLATRDPEMCASGLNRCACVDKTIDTLASRGLLQSKNERAIDTTIPPAPSPYAESPDYLEIKNAKP